MVTPNFSQDLDGLVYAGQEILLAEDRKPVLVVGFGLEAYAIDKKNPREMTLLAKREGPVSSLAVCNGTLFDAGDYKHIYNTLTGKVAFKTGVNTHEMVEYNGELYYLDNDSNLWHQSQNVFQTGVSAIHKYTDEDNDQRMYIAYDSREIKVLNGKQLAHHPVSKNVGEGHRLTEIRVYKHKVYGLDLLNLVNLTDKLDVLPNQRVFSMGEHDGRLIVADGTGIVYDPFTKETVAYRQSNVANCILSVPRKALGEKLK